MTYKDFTMHQPDFLNDSDDSSDRKGYYHPNSHMSEHDSSMKRGGNNHFGSTGILKCLQCRRRKGKCEYTDHNQSCRFCADRDIECGTKYSAKGAHAHELSLKLQKLREEAGTLPFTDVSKLSAIALELERRFPGSSIAEIYTMAKEPVETAAAVQAGSASLFQLQHGHQLQRPGVSTPAPRKTPTTSARHTPVPENPYRALPRISTPQPSLHTSHHPQDPETSEVTYDIDSWLTTFPSSSSNQIHSNPQEFAHISQNDLSALSMPTNIYVGLQPRPRFRTQVPTLHTDEGELDYSHLIHHQPQ